MTDRIALPAAAFVPSTLAERRAGARHAARRHSAIVKVLRRAMVAGLTLGLGGILVVVVFDPFGAVTHGAAIEGVGIDGTKITMTSPKLSGFHKDGRPYAIEASRAVQDIRTPTLFELHDIKARLTMADRSVTRLSAATGSYNSVTETIHLTDGAHVVSDSGLDAVTQDAVVAFKTNALTTDKPVTVSMPGRRIAADRMHISEGGKAVTFEGHVHTEMDPAQETAVVAGAAP